MNHLAASLIWCWIQALAVGVTALGLTLLTLRRSPTGGAAIAVSGIVALLLLAGLAIVPISLPVGSQSMDYLVGSDLRVSRSAIAIGPTADTASAEVESSSGIAIDPSLLHNLWRSLQSSQSAVEQHQQATWWVLIALAAGSALGLVRLIAGCAEIGQIVRHSLPLSDERVRTPLADLLPRLGLHHCPEVRETSDLTSAAVAGWWRPIVLLPAAWRDWTPEELKAVLAHELAHIARQDALWRLIAAASVILHWSQPLVHWLRYRLLLAQELAADDLAAAALGSKQNYLQALAKLALRQDASPDQRIGQATLVPVFSGFLLRRIDMLRAKDGSLPRAWRLWTQATAIGLVALVTLIATTIRAVAEPPEREADGSLRVADAAARPPLPDGAKDAEAAMFRRPVLDIAKYALSEKGGFVIRIGEICQQRRFAPLVHAYDEQLAQYWKDAFPGAEAPPCSLADVDFLLGDCEFSARYVPAKEEDPFPHPHQVLFGFGCGVIRWKGPVEPIFAWLKKTPGAEVQQYGEINYVAIPIAAMGPVNTCFCCLDDHTLLWAGGEGVLKKRLDRLSKAAEPPAWAQAWKELDGGLITAVSALAEYKNPPTENIDEAERVTQDFFAKTQLKSFAADWLPQAGGHVGLKLRLTTESEADARLIEQHIHRVLQMMIQDRDENPKEPANDQIKAASEAVKAFMDHPRIEMREVDGHWQIDIRFTGPIPLESFQ